MTRKDGLSGDDEQGFFKEDELDYAEPMGGTVVDDGGVAISSPPRYNAKLLPLTGVVYFLTHPRLYGLACAFCCLQVVAFIVVSVIAWSTFPAQLDSYEKLFEAEWEAVLAAIFSVLSENVIIFCILVYVVILPCVQDRIYRAVFEMEGVPWNPSQEGCCVDCGRGLCIKLVFVLVLIVTFPANIIPVIGPFVWSACGSFFVAWDILDRYFGHKKIAFATAWGYARSHFADFFCFGFLVMLLSLVPLLQLLLMYTNLVAGALWACDLERSNALRPYDLLSTDDHHSVELHQFSQQSENEL